MESRNAHKRRSLTAADNLTASTKQGQWGARVMVLRPFDDFWKKMEPDLLLVVLGPRRGGFALTDEEEAQAKQMLHRLRVPLGEFKNTLYRIAELMIDIRNNLTLQSIAIPEVRRLGKSFDRSMIGVRESKKLITTASAIATSELVPHVNGGIPEFARTINALDRLESRLSKLRSAVAATLPPKERKSKDRKLAPLSPWKTAHELAPLTKSIRALDYIVVYLIERGLSKFSRLPFSVHGIDKLIACFFYLANNCDVEKPPRESPSEENIKHMRHNLRTGKQSVPRWLSAHFPPPAGYKKRQISRKNQAKT
jgi:hypothetical protein